MNNIKKFEEFDWKFGFGKDPYKGSGMKKFNADPIEREKIARKKPERPENIPYEIQSEYDILISRMMDGSADPDIDEVEDKVEELRKLYPNIKTSWNY